ncbi:Cuticle protein 16.8 like protein [Argiope bruennichi]|uniref:Cuticle protein 16.8 like protein n=2 Tax=Argiope bruennichi TaxID=94029 RepID=A0A8T0EIJ0_ARGBR|nr:Cuticle protein 16.8 like protein [Argiope bruennichi]
MILIVSLFCVSVSLTSAAPAYGKDGGYTGYASYVPLKNQLQNSIGRYSDDSIHASAGSPDITRKPIKELAPAPQRDYEAPTNLAYQTPQHGYDSNRLGHDTPAVPYAKASLYGQEGGYKIADAYQNGHIDSYEDKEHDYKDDYIANPQPYEYGYALKDEYGNAQHRKESSDGQGKVEGSYGFTDEHGLYRSVQYVADKEGFRASIKTNEPGTESQNPADVHLDSEQSKY